MRIKVRALRHILSEASTYYDLETDDVKSRWEKQYNDAIEFVSKELKVDAKTAEQQVSHNWVFDVIEHEGQDYLIARDEAEGASLAYVPKMGGWYYRMGRH